MYEEISTKRDTLHELYIYGAELGTFGFPRIPSVYAQPKESVSFREIQKVIDTKGKAVHFYIDDMWFEKVWTNADRYIEQLKCFPFVIMPDFSVTKEMPQAMQLWQRYRSMALAYYFTQHRIKVIPSLGVLSEGDTWTTECVPKHSTLAVCTNGRIKRKTGREEFLKALYEQIEILEPKNLIMVGYIPEEWKEPVPTIYLKSEAQKEYERKKKKNG